ncbi:hypothetical protein CPB83DRAFT_909739 [Crepidotus variabilis]|uniref:F-box domain-containing protein n=1 Tax=Crepidotus variabilis TaxID=179855 RepID=A0A9P6E962_9AGAR|nr:hypothetical protein CPB83DRAFT_909739 [Crepidotus variabilis]
MSSSPLVNLSDEMRLAITNLLASEKQNDLLNLSSTCRSYRAFLSPNIFTKVILRNDNESGLAMQRFLRSENKTYAKELHYKGVAAIPPDHINMVDVDAEEQLDEPDTVFSGPTREVLRDLEQFPNLERLIVEFPWTEEDLQTGFYHFEEEEEEAQVVEREGKHAWRAIMARTYAAIGENKNFSTVKSLELRGVVAKAVSSWWTTDFQIFLGSLRDFKLSVVPMENGAGWCQSTNEGYLDFLSNLGDDLTSHLYNVETLFIAGNDKGPIGCQGDGHVPCSLGVEDLPKLRLLHLKYFFLDPPLIEFIESHIETLEAIILDECFGTGDTTLAENGYDWKEVFDRITTTKPKRLTRFDLTWEHIELSWDDTLEGYQDSDEVRAGKAMLESGRRAFAYGHLDSKYGALFQDDEANIEKLLNGEDFKAYCALMNIVKANAT